MSFGKNMTTMAPKIINSASIINCTFRLLPVKFVAPLLIKTSIKMPERKSKNTETIILMLNFFFCLIANYSIPFDIIYKNAGVGYSLCYQSGLAIGVEVL